MKTKLFTIILILAFTVSLYACTEGVKTDNSVVENVEITESVDSSAEESETEESAEPTVSEDVSTDDEDNYVQRGLTEDMIKEIWRISDFSDYNPKIASHEVAMISIKSNYYANHSISGYTLCHFDCGFSNDKEFEYLKDGYFFTTGNDAHPSHLSLYLYKDGKFITIEDALDSGLANAADLYEILSSDPNYGVKAKII